MQRPDITTLFCVNPECQLFAQPGKNNLKIRKVYGQDQLRFLHCNECREEFSERPGSALFNSKIPEEKALGGGLHRDRHRQVGEGSQGHRSSTA